MTDRKRKARGPDLRRALVEPTLGKRLQAVRKALGLTGAQVVEMIPGLNRSTLSEIENDVSRRTSYLEPLARIYGISEETLLRPDLGSLIREETPGERIRRRREELNYTRNELADAIPGLSYHVLFMIETRDRPSDYTTRIATFLGLNRPEEETNASALLRLMRTDLFMDSTMLCEIAGCAPDLLDRAQDGDTAAAVRIILDLSQGLLQDRLATLAEAPPSTVGVPDDDVPDRHDSAYSMPGKPMTAEVHAVDESGRLVLPPGEGLPIALALADGRRLYAADGVPQEGEYALAIVAQRGGRAGILGTYQPEGQPHGTGRTLIDPSNISHAVPTGKRLHRMLPLEERLTS
jgi:hypothetical protein